MLLYLFYFKPTHALFLKHTQIHTQNSKLLKMFVKHTIKTLHVSVTTVWTSSGGRPSCPALSQPSPPARIAVINYTKASNTPQLYSYIYSKIVQFFV